MGTRKSFVLFLLASSACGDGDAVIIDPDRPCLDEYAESITLHGDDDPLEVRRVREVGILEISESNAIDLEGLGGCLERAHEIRIANNPALESLAGLDALLEVVATEPGTAVRGENPIEAIDAKLVVSDNPALIDLGALRHVRVIEGDLELRGNDALLSTEGLESLESTSAGVVVENNAALATLSLPAFYLTNEPFVVRDNPSLRKFGPFGSVQDKGFEVHGLLAGLLIEKNENLATIGALSDWSVSYSLQLRQLPSLASLPDMFFPVPFSDRSALELLVVEECHGLANLHGLGRLAHGETIVIRNNNTLESFSGLEHVEAGGLIVDNNANLRSLAAIDSSRSGAFSTAHHFEVTDNPNLPACEPESVLSSLKNAPDSIIRGNDGDGECL